MFKYWEDEFYKTSNTVLILGLFVNFKIFRMFYSRLQDKKNFNAIFKDKIIFYRSIMFTSVFYLIVGTLPIIVASCFGLVYVRFGY